MTPGGFRAASRRRLLNDLHARAGAVFAAHGDDHRIASFGDAAAEADALARLSIVDLSHRRRIGIKGPGSRGWLQARGIGPLPEPNRCRSTTGGMMVAALSSSEFLLSDETMGNGDGCAALARGEITDADECYFVEHYDALFCFALTGDELPALYGRCCAVDLRSAKAPPGTVFQTRFHHLNVILARGKVDALPVDLLFGDSASATQAWSLLAAGIGRHGGRPAGTDALRTLLGGAARTDVPGTNSARPA